jgi:hypothetical protein
MLSIIFFTALYMGAIIDRLSEEMASNAELAQQYLDGKMIDPKVIFPIVDKITLPNKNLVIQKLFIEARIDYINFACSKVLNRLKIENFVSHKLAMAAQSGASALKQTLVELYKSETLTKDQTDNLCKIFGIAMFAR